MGRVNGFAKIYNDAVKKADKKNNPDRLKKCAELFFSSVENEFTTYDNSKITFEDIEYLDGYYIFGFGTNSVVNFHVKECPGWLFGIWWSVSENKNRENHVSGDFFAQYEDTLDKFKPERSPMRSHVYIYPDNSELQPDIAGAAKMIAFIRNEPYLAFCRDYCFWDYNCEYHTRQEAKKVFDKWKVWFDNKNKFSAELDNKILDFVREKIVPRYEECEIFDDGEDTSPRYQLMASYKKNKHWVDEAGLYGWFENTKNDKELKKEFYKLEKECRKVSDKYKFIWYKPIDDSVYFYNKRPKDGTII